MFLKLLLIVATSFIAQGPEILPGTPRLPPQSSADMCKTGWGPDPTTGRYVFIIQISPNALAAFSEGIYGNDLVAKVPENLRPFIEETIVRIGTGTLPQIPPTPEMRDAVRRLDQPTLTMLDERRGPVDIDRSVAVSGQSNLNNSAPILPPTNKVSDNGFSNAQRTASDILPSSPTAPNTTPNPYRPTTAPDVPSLDQIRALANNGMPNNGMPNNGLPNNGMTNNGLTNNGMTNNGLTNNGLTNNGMTNNGMPNNGMTNNGMTNNGMTNNGYGTNSGSGQLGNNPSGFPVSTNTNPQTPNREDSFRPGNSVATNSMFNRMTGNTPPSVGSYSAPYDPNYSRTASNSVGSPLTPPPVNTGFSASTPAWGSSIPPTVPAGYDQNYYLAAANSVRSPAAQTLPGTQPNGVGANGVTANVRGGEQPADDSRFGGTVQWLPFVTIFLLVVNIYQFFWMAHVRTRYKELVISKRNAQLNLAG